jgi:hypothetical protein
MVKMEQFANDLQKQFHFDAINGLLAMKNEAITYFVQRNFLCKRVEPIQSIWQLKEVKTLLQKQQDDGSWNNPGKKIHQYPSHHYPLLETWKRFRILVNQYQFNKQQIPIKKAAEFLFSCQTDTGDFRGMIGDQYVTYYTGAFLAALIRSGYSADDRIEKGFKWLLSMRQNDGGWTIPILTHSFDRKTSYYLTSAPCDPVEPDKNKPFSHNWTDMVLRAFAAHPRYRKSKEALAAALLLKSRFFKKDVYHSYESKHNWTRFAFWWPNILTSLESLALMGFSKNDPDIKRGLQWFIDNQQQDGLWLVNYWPGKKQQDSRKITIQKGWISLRVCNLFKIFNNNNDVI